MDKQQRQRASGRIGGLTAWSRHGSETMQAGARRGFRLRFLNIVDADRVLPEAEREARADRAMRAYMLTLSAKSAAARRKAAAKSGPDGSESGG